MRAAFELLLVVYEKGNKETVSIEEKTLVSDVYWLNDSCDIQYDFVDPFLDSEEFEKLEPAVWHIFQYGTVSGETSYTEYGPEFDGWIFEPEITSCDRVCDLDKSEPK